MSIGYKVSELGQIPLDWDVKSLNDLCTGILDGTHQTPKYVPEGVPFYSVENVTANNFKTSKFISVEEHQELIRRCEPEKGDILMTRIGSLAETKLIDWDINASIYVSLALLKIDPLVDSSYVYQYTRFIDFKNEVLRRSLLTAYPQKINLSEIGKVQIRVPKSLQEQKQIAAILSTVDEKIGVIDAQITHTQELKLGLMQRLLTKGIGHMQFKQSQLGEIPEEWNVTTIGTTMNLINGCAFKPTEWQKSGLPIIRIQNLNDPTAPFNYSTKEVDDKMLSGSIFFNFSASGKPEISRRETTTNWSTVPNQFGYNSDSRPDAPE